MPTERFIDLTADLRRLGGGRVWSLMISLFGDLALEEDRQIDGPVLSAIMQGLAIKPEAARVALHRLRNDGWVLSQKSGRISQHSLSPKGRAESQAASPRIYAAPDLQCSDWQLILTQESDPEQSLALTHAGFTQISPRVFVGPKTANAPPGTLSLTGGQAPDWIRKQAEPVDLHQGYSDLLTCLTPLVDTLPNAAQLSSVEIAVLRCLIVHNWRRLVLRHAALPAPLIAPDWPGHQCHLQVHRLLNKYPRPGLEAIERACAED